MQQNARRNPGVFHVRREKRGSMSIIGVEQKKKPNTKEHVARHMLLRIRCYAAQCRILLRKLAKLRTP